MPLQLQVVVQRDVTSALLSITLGTLAVRAAYERWCTGNIAHVQPIFMSFAGPTTA